MAIFKTDISITDEFTGAGGGGVENLQGGVLNKHVATLDFYSFLAYENLYLLFNAAGKTITNCNEIDFRSFLEDGDEPGKGLAIGRIISVENSVSNNGTFTITEITERVITVAEVVVNETLNAVGAIFDDTPVEFIDFYQNLIENRNEVSFLSLTDTGAIQRFKRSNVDASDVAVLDMSVSSASFGWVTNTISDPITGETTEVTIQGVSITDHKQNFKLIQTFHISPFATNAQVENIREMVAPDYFQNNNALKYIWRIDASFAPCADPPHTGTFIEPFGISNWFNQNNKRTRPDSFIDSITFADSEANPLTGIDINKKVDVVITLKSRAGLFTAAVTEVAVDFLYLPLNESRYINTPDTTLRENFINDRKFLAVDTQANGEFFGTDFQVLTDVNPVYVDDNTITISLTTDFSAALKSLFESLPIDNRNYIFAVTTQDETIATTSQCNRVVGVHGIAQIEWDQQDPTLLQAVDNVHVCPLPHKQEDESNCDPDPNCANTSIAGYEGDIFTVKFPFRVKKTSIDDVTPTINKAGFQIVAVKAGKENFVVEEKIFDSTFVRKLGGVQTIDFSEERQIAVHGSLQKYILKKDSQFDEGAFAGFIAEYPLTLRYDFWAQLVQTAERVQFDLFKDIAFPTEAWNTLQQGGWSLKVRFTAEVKGYTDFVNEFEQFWDIDAKALGEDPDVGPIFESVTTYQTLDKTLLNAILIGGKTIITTTYLGDFSTLPVGMESFYAYIFADLENVGGVDFRKFAITEFDVGDDQVESPFKATKYNGLAGNHWASENLRINIFGTEKITVETIYDDSIDNWGALGNSILFFPRLGFMNNNCFLVDSVGEYVLSAKGQRIKINCECDDSHLEYYT